MAGLIKKVALFFREEIWRMHAGRKGVQRALISTLQVALLVGKRFRDDKGFIRASALAYTTLLSLVPLLAFAFALMKGLGADEQLREYLHKPVAAQGQGGVEGMSLLDRLTGGRPEVADKILDYINHTNAAALGAFGLLILVWTVVKVLGTVEVTFNDIWGVQRGRTWVRKFADYTSIMVIAPIILVTAGTVFTRLMQSMLKTSGTVATVSHTAGMVVGWLSLPVLMWILFAAFYSLMPNTTVGFVPALVGGIVGGTLWQAAFWAYTACNVGVAKYNAIYTSFAALPIFLVWLYFSWVIVIVGAEAAYAQAHIETYRQSLVRFEPSSDARELVTMRVFLEIASAFRHEGPAPGDDELAEKARVPVRAVRDIIDVLERSGLVVRIGAPGPTTSKPGRDLAAITLADVLLAIRHSGDGTRAGDNDKLWVETERLHSVITDSLSQGDLGKSVSALLDRIG